jgi:hypothetical protein
MLYLNPQFAISVKLSTPIVFTKGFTGWLRLPHTADETIETYIQMLQILTQNTLLK